MLTPAKVVATGRSRTVTSLAHPPGRRRLCAAVNEELQVGHAPGVGQGGAGILQPDRNDVRAEDGGADFTLDGRHHAVIVVSTVIHRALDWRSGHGSNSFGDRHRSRTSES